MLSKLESDVHQNNRQPRVTKGKTLGKTNINTSNNGAVLLLARLPEVRN